MSKVNLGTLSTAFIEVFSSGPYHDKWYSDEQLLTIVNGSYDLSHLIGDDIQKGLATFNRANSKNPKLAGLDNKFGSTDTGIFQMKFTIVNEHKKKIQRWFYYIASCKSSLPLNLTAKGAQEVYDRVIRKSTRKRARRDDNNEEDNLLDLYVSSKQLDTLQPTVQPHYEYSFWESTDAKRLFAPKDDELAIVALHRMIKVCDMNADKAIDSYGDYYVKYLMLRKAYVLALENMNTWTWKACCQSALNLFSETGFNTIKSAATIMRWNRYFRVYNTLMPSQSKQTKEFQPKLFSVYPEAKMAVNLYFSKNLEKINVDGFRTFMLEEAIPKLIIDTNNNNTIIGSEPLEVGELLTSINLKSLGLATSYKYLRYLGYRFDRTKKSYYNDGHEKPEQLKYRKQFIAEYFRNELSCYVWVQLSEDAAIEKENLEKNALLQGIAHCYNIGGVDMREYHVDCHDSFKELVNINNQQYGGNLSVRMNEFSNPCICVGEDESAYSQFAFSSKTWKGPNGEETLKPKGEGETLMVAAFCSRAFGLGRKLTEEELFAINKYRDETRSTYVASSEAMELNGTTRKEQLKDNSPFLRYFEVGAEKEGFWNYLHMALMTEDLIDCLQVLYPNHSILFYFDQSSGHCRKRTDGLNVICMNSDWGGMQKKMRDTTITDGCLGTFNAKLTIGDVQSLIFLEDDTGPHYVRRNCNKRDSVIGRKRRKKNKSELLQELIMTRTFNHTKIYTKQQLESLASDFGIDLHHEVDEVREGWVGKPKGLFQILWERGWIDPNKRYSDYSLDGKSHWKDERNEVLEQYLPFCLRHLLSECTDFKNEVSALEDLALKLSTETCNIKINFTPKYHCEIAGEGIEYAWGYSKRYYRNLPFARKKGIKNFRESVRESVDVVSVDNVRKFGGRIRRYMLAYCHFDQKDASTDGDNNKEKATYEAIENFVRKESKSHRSVLDSETGYLSKVWRDSMHVPVISED
jgi:hypothetical protein